MPKNTPSPDIEAKLQAITRMPTPSAKFVDNLWLKMEAKAQTHRARSVPGKPVWDNILRRFQTAGRWAMSLAAIGLLVAVTAWAIELRPQDTTEPGSDPVTSQASVPYPTPIPIEVFPTPAVEELAIIRTEGSPWTTYIPQDWQALLQQTQETPWISAILAARDGSYWFASMGGITSIGTGVYRYDGQTWTHYTTQNGLPADEISAMAAAPDGALWFGTLCCGATRYDGRTWTTYTADHGLESNDVRALAVAPDGSIWFGTGDHGVSRFDGTDWETYTTLDGLSGNYVGGIFPLPEDSLLLSTSDGRRASLDWFDGQGWSPYPTDWTAQGKYTQNIAYSPNGDLWFTTEFDGVYRLAGDTWTHFTGENGLPDGPTRGLAVASDGTVWVGTDQGVARFDGQGWTVFSAQAGLASNWVTSLAAAKDGSIWVGMNGGISRYTATDLAQSTASDTAQPTPREMPLSLPAGLVVEEYALVGAPRTEPRSFTPVEGTAASILRKHPISGREPVYFSNRVQLGPVELAASEKYNQTGSEGWVSLEQDGSEIYRIETGPGSPISSLRGLWVYDGHWVLETAQINRRQEENTVYTDAVGQITQDGELLNTLYGYDEMFGFQTLAGRPFYFFNQDGEIGFSYDGQTVMAGYDTIPHYNCCSAGELNPHPSTNMIAFFAQMDGQWYYVEIGVYE